MVNGAICCVCFPLGPAWSRLVPFGPAWSGAHIACTFGTKAESECPGQAQATQALSHTQRTLAIIG